MKATFLSIVALLFFFASASAQDALNKPGPNGKTGEFTPWYPATYTTKDNKVLNLEYRITLKKRTGIGCRYAVEIKNNSDQKVKGVVTFHYTTVWLPTAYNEGESFSVKPGQTAEVEYTLQGCKKQDKSADDYKACLDCPFEYYILIKD